MAKTVKKKKPFWVRILKWIFGTILLLALTLGGFCLYLYFRYNINVIEVVQQVKVLNQEVKVDEIATNQFTEDDLTSAKNKIDNISTSQNSIRLSDKEIAAYLDDTIKSQENGLPITVGSSTVNLVDYGFAIVQIEFSNIPDDSNSEKMTDFNIVLKIELKKLKQDNMSGFPLSWVAKSVPVSLYFSCNVEINKTSIGYETVSKYMTINNLSDKQTESLFKTFDTFIKIGKCDDFNKSISDGFVRTLIGEDGLYDQLNSQGKATGYSFTNDWGSNDFIIYTASVTENHSITYHDGSDSEIEYYNLSDNIFIPKNEQKAGYEFLGWFDGEGDGANQITSIDATLMEDLNLYARWQLKEYNINYSLNGGAVVGTNPTKYTVEDENFTLINPTKEHYIFKGWTWENNSTPTKIVTITTGSITGDINFVAVFEADAYTINYRDKNNATFTGVFDPSYPTSHTYGQATTLPLPTKVGFTFDGWFLDQACQNNQITQIAASVNENVTVYANWTIIEYSITYHLNDGIVDGENPISYNLNTNTFTLKNPTKENTIFLGWIGTDLISETNIVIISQGSTGDREYRAIFENDERELTIIVDGNTVKKTTFKYGNSISTSNILNSEEVGMAGYSVTQWYSDPEMTTTFDTTQKYYGNTSIYGSWDYLTNRIYFYPYLSEFEALNSNDVYEIKSQNHLVAYLDYVKFYNITKQVRLKIKYASNTNDSVANAITSACNTLAATSDFQTLSILGYSVPQYNGQYYAVCYITDSQVNKQASKVMDLTNTYTYTQKDYALKSTLSVSSRAYNIENVPKTEINK